MRFLKLLFTGLFALVAVLAGLFATIIAALAGIVFIASRRLQGSRRGSTARPRVHVRTQRMPPGDAIDVAATEVSSEQPREEERLPLR